MNLNLKDADIQGVLVPAFFASPHPSNEALKEARAGLHNLTCAVVTILDQGVSPHVLRVDDLIDYIGGITPKDFADSIMEAQKVARDQYDGTFDPPAVLPLEKKLYSIAAIVLSEIGRRSDEMHGSSLTTESRMMTFIKKNEFYEYSDVFAERFGITESKPTLSQVAKLGFETFEYYKHAIEERNI